MRRAPCATATASPGQHGAGHGPGTAPSTPLAAHGGNVWGKSANPPPPPSTTFGRPEQGEHNPSPLLLPPCDEAAGSALRRGRWVGSAGVPRHWGHAALLAHAKKRVIRVKFRPLERGAETDGADDRKAGGGRRAAERCSKTTRSRATRCCLTPLQGLFLLQTHGNTRHMGAELKGECPGQGGPQQPSPGPGLCTWACGAQSDTGPVPLHKGKAYRGACYAHTHHTGDAKKNNKKNLTASSVLWKSPIMTRVRQDKPLLPTAALQRRSALSPLQTKKL